MPESLSDLNVRVPSETPSARVLSECLKCLSVLRVFKCALRAHMSDQIRSEQNTKHKKMYVKKTKIAKKILRKLILKQNQRADLKKPFRVSSGTCKFCSLCGHLY